MKPLSYFAVESQQVATHPVKLLKLEATLNASATAGLFLQLHDSNTPPAEGALPVKTWPAAECGFKEFELGELVFSAGLYVCLSTTGATKTLAVGASDKCDILNVELVDPEVPTGTSNAGTLGSGTQELQVWADGAGPKKLLRVEINNIGNGVNYLMIFAKDSPANGDIPLDVITIPTGVNWTGKNALYFGQNGRDVFCKSSAGVNQNGCTLTLSSTPNFKTLTAQAAPILAEYK